MKKSFKEGFFRILYNYLIFFLLSAFLVTCTTSLFVSVLSYTLDVELTDENVQMAAKLTFLNVILLSVIFTVIDVIRRKVTTEKITKNISSSAKKIIDGDFSVRIDSSNSLFFDNNYKVIVDCFNTMAEELASVETLRTDFVSNVSHEMKTPLSVIQNYCALLQSDGLEEDKRKEYAKVVTSASRRLSDMVTNILKLNRLENQQIYPKNEKYNLSEQLCGCLLQFENVWEDCKIEIDTDIKEDLFIFADSELLSLVWNNLFSNAFKFTSEGGTVNVSLFEEDDYAVVKVKDTGCGMPPEVGVHIFEKFYQGDTSHSTQGNGLGLALVKRVIDIIGGEIFVESAVSVGTTFTVKIKRG